jgi:RHS repeat-associated protein
MSYVREGRKKNQFLYNGKELVEGYELGWYDYGARYYAPDLGRWHAVDPLAEKFWDYSSYNYAVNDPIKHYDIDGNDVVNSLKGEAHREALKTFVKTKKGREFIAKFASKGQIIGGVKFSQDGIYANHTLVLNSKDLFSAGETKHYVKKSNGDKISISNISTKSIIDLNGDLNFQFEINISNDRNEEEATETIGHEAFIHVDDDVQELEGYKEDYENGKFGDDGAESLRFKGKIGKVEVDGIEEHDNAINGQNSNMDIFINQIVELTGNDSYRRIY